MHASAVYAILFAAALLPQQRHRHPQATHHGPVRMTATAYCDKGTTDGHINAQRGIVAADPRLLPIGSRIRVTGLGPRAQTYLVADTGSAVKGRHIDVFVPSCRAAKRFGKKPVRVKLISSAK